MIAVVAILGCGSSGSSGPLPERAAEVFDRISVDTANGLSGLATDETGALWTVAERDEKAYRIRLDGVKPSVETFAVTGVPTGIDLEGMAVLGGGKLALGTEGRSDGVATVLLAEVHGSTVVVTGSIELPAARVGIPLEKNHGAEGVCGIGDTIVVGIEGAGVDTGRRWAPVLRIEHGAITRRYRVWLTTKTGKLAGLDCRRTADGIEVLAVERHFEETKLLTFTLRDAEDITPHVAIDLAPVIAGKLNLEGVAWLPDGRAVAVVDNQWKTITGPNELLVFKPGALH